MAQLVTVCRGENHQFRRRQLPLMVDESLTMVVEFAEPCSSCCEQPAVVQSQLDTFVRNMQQLSNEQISSALKISRMDILNQVSQLVPCVGCRHSVERLFDELSELACLALDPLQVTKSGMLTVTAECGCDAKSLFTLIYVRRSNAALEMASKVKKGKRCTLHSLDLHKSKALWTWNEVWDVSSKECRDEITQIDSDSLLVTVEEYLRKHRFCTECKSKVLRAYGILVDDPDISGITAKLDRSSAGGQCRALFREVKACSTKRHIHVPCDEKYLKDVIERAEPELCGNPTERHAKSMEIAQEEVLTCLGVHLHDRFFRIQQKLKVEGKAWQLLFAISVDALRRNIEVAFERNRGGQSVDMICQQLMLDEEKVQAPKRPRAKKKKGGSKSASQPVEETQSSETLPSAAGANKTTSSCLCTSGSDKRAPLSSDANHNSVLTAALCNTTCSAVTSDSHCTSGSAPLHESCCTAENQPTGQGHSDLGYASDGDCESCSSQSLARSGGESENSHSSGCCSPSSSAAAVETDASSTCQCDQLGIKCRTGCQFVRSCSPAVSATAVDGCSLEGCSLSRYGTGTVPSLEDMLMASEDDSEDFEISEDVIRQYRANEQVLARERLALRQTLRQKFESMQQRTQQWHEDSVTDVSIRCKDTSATVHA